MAGELKLLFLFKTKYLLFGGIIDPEGNTLEEITDADEVAALSKKLFKEHQEIFSNPKDENIGFDTDFVIEDLKMSNDHILDGRVLKWGLSLEDAPAACLFDGDKFIRLNKTFFAFIEITYNGEIDDDSIDQIASDIESSSPYTFKVGGYEFLTLGDQPEYEIAVNLVGDEYWEELGFTAEYEPEMKELLEGIRSERNELHAENPFLQWK